MFSNLYDKKYLFQCLSWLGIVFGLMRVTGGAGFAIVIPMILYCVLARKTEGLLFWLLVAVCAVIINPYLVMKAGGFPWMQRGVMLSLGFVMTVNVMAYRLHYLIRPYAGMFFYIGFMACSSAFGWCPIISYLKLILFSLVYSSYLGVSNQVGMNVNVSGRKIRSIMLAFAILLVLGSIALVPFPGFSQLKAADFQAGKLDLSSTVSLFIGMTNHSQCLGPVVSSISVILLGDLLFSVKKADVLYVLLLLCCPYLIYQTSSRTGMGAYMLGMLFVIYIFFIKARGIAGRWKSRVFSFLIILSVVAMFVLLVMPGFQNKIVRFVLKTQSADSVQLTSENVFSSRQGLIDFAIYNFKKRPLIGNGFQVSAFMENLKIKNVAHLLSAPVEKGVWVTAVLEEGGIFGCTIFVIFLVVCVVKSIKRQAYIAASCLFLCTLTNLGEFTFFSMSYTGGFTWAMVFVGLALDVRRMRDEEWMMYNASRLRYSAEVGLMGPTV